jgi:diacylglycerol kinase (ATP)
VRRGSMSQSFLAIVNPAAGGGRCGKLAKTALAKVRAAGIEIEVAETSAPGDATRLARAAYARGQRQFLAVGGDGTTYEIVNGLFPEATADERPTLGFLDLGRGTGRGNAFLRHFTDRGDDYTIESILKGRRRTCDVLRLEHSGGEIYFLNQLSMGFPADIATFVRRFKAFGELGYLFGVLFFSAHRWNRAIPLRVDDEPEFDNRPCLFLTFGYAYFAGNAMIGPNARVCDSLIEYVRYGLIGRFRFLRGLGTLFVGSQIMHPLASRRSVRRIEFALNAPVDVMIDGELLTLDCRRIEVLAGAFNAVV